MTTTNSAAFGLQLGRFLLLPPLDVVLKEQPNGKWLAVLEPAEMTHGEWGYGATPELALHDLASTIEEMMEFFAKAAEERLGPALLTYKHTLAQYVSVNTTSVSREGDLS